MSKKSHHFLTLWPWPLTYDLEKLIRSGHYHYHCVYQIWEQSISWFFSYRVNTIAGGGRRAAGGGRLRRKTITSPDPSDTGDIKNPVYRRIFHVELFPFYIKTASHHNRNIPITRFTRSRGPRIIKVGICILGKTALLWNDPWTQSAVLACIGIVIYTTNLCRTHLNSVMKGKKVHYTKIPIYKYMVEEHYSNEVNT